MNYRNFSGATVCTTSHGLEDVRVQAIQAVGTNDVIIRIHESTWEMPWITNDDGDIVRNEGAYFDLPITKGQTIYGMFQHFEVLGGTVIAYHV